MHKPVILALALLAAHIADAGAGTDPSATPRLPDGHPDLNGTWENGGGIDFLRPQKGADGSVCVRDCGPPPKAATGASAPAARPAPDRPRYRPEFLAQVRDLTEKQVQLDPVLRCKPPGVPRIGPPDKIVQTAREVVFLYEDVSGPFFRIVPLDPKARRNDTSESYLGDALGRWEDDTLVVESRNFNADSWLTDDGAFHTTALRVTERLRRVGSAIEYSAVADDPQVLAEPWKLRPRQMQLTDVEMAEPAPCFDQDLQLMQDGSYHSNPR
jgi:hypothetical protein